MKIFAHTSHIGSTGYNAHSQGFFRELSKNNEVKIRNFSVGKNWRGLEAADPHGIDASTLDKNLLHSQTLFDQDVRRDFPIYSNDPSFAPEVNIILNNVDHYYFYDNYEGKKVAYVVWENSWYPESFFNKLKEFDQVWVASSWQKQITIDQGIAANKVKVVPEAVDSSIYFPKDIIWDDGVFRFLIFGAWCSRKSTKELIQAFKEVFGGNPNVELLLSVENRFANDGFSSTEERLARHNLSAPNIKILPFLGPKEYVEHLQAGHVFLSCARGEGWNIPLLEAMACGTPSIYSNCSGQLEFAKDYGIPVSADILISANSFEDKNAVGFWYEPDFEELKRKMLEVHQNYRLYKEKALQESIEIRKKFTWESAASLAQKYLKELTNPNILVSCSFIGNGGFNSLCQNLLPELNNHVNIRVRNFTVEPDWGGYSFEPHGQHIKEEHKPLMLCQTLIDSVRADYPIYNKDPFVPDLHLIINEANHLYFYDNYDGLKIAYSMMETTEFPIGFLNRLQSFDQFWVPSEWQKSCLLKQNFPESKIKVVPLGVDSSIFNTKDKKLKQKFTFGIFGRWDQRKNTKEIVKCFKELFGDSPNVELIISADNPYDVDGFSTTEKRLEAYDLACSNIRVLHFPSKEEYVAHLKSIHVFLSCSKGEGWNLPLIEAMACGVPSIYSNCSGQTEYAADLGIPVKISHTESARNHLGIGQFCEEDCGEYYIPDFEDLKKKMLDVYSNYLIYSSRALIESSFIRIKFSWSSAAKKASEYLSQLLSKQIKFVRFTDNGRGIEYSNNSKTNFPITVQIRDSIGDNVLYQESFTVNSGVQYFSTLNDSVSPRGNLLFKISDSRGEILLEEELKRKNNISVCNESPSLGDCIAWMGAVDLFQKSKNAPIDFFTPYKYLFSGQYPNINFYNYSDKPVKTDYSLGCFDTPKKKWQEYNLQELGCELLNIPFQENRPRIRLPDKLKNNFAKKYVCISIQSTSQAKYWNNPDGWNQVVLYLNSLGYDVVCIDKHHSFGSLEKMNVIPDGCVDKTGDIPLEERINDLYFCEFFIGLSSGLSWLAWAMNKPVILISGFTRLGNEFYTPYRPYNKNICTGCVNKPDIKFTPSNWMWCPENKDFECSRQISFEMVKESIDQLISDSKRNS